MDIIECSIKMKEERRHHYEQLANFTNNKELKRLAMLLVAADDELILQLRKMKDGPDAAVLAEGAIGENVCVFTPRFDPQHPEESLKRDSDAYLHVVKEVEDAIAFYEQLGTRTESGPMKAIFCKLVESEREHLSVVENIYSFVEDPRTYLEWGEFSNLRSL